MNLPNVSRKSKLTLHSSLNINHFKAKLGFTLIELLVVITIIGILAGLGAVSYSNAQQKSRDSKRKSDIQSIRQAFELYIQTNGVYPPTTTTNGNPCGRLDQASNATFYNAMTGYINPMPQDPVYKNVPGDYVYFRLTDTSYFLGSLLENTDDPDYDLYAAGGYPTLGITCAGYSTNYHYRVGQP